MNHSKKEPTTLSFDYSEFC